MSETILLVLLSVVVVIVIRLARMFIAKRKMYPWDATALEIAVQVILCLTLSLIAHAFYRSGTWIAIVASATLIFGTAYFFDRIARRETWFP